MSGRPDWLGTSDAAELWRRSNSLAVTLGYPDGTEAEPADLFGEIRKLQGPPDPLRHEHNSECVLEAIKVLEAEWDGLEPVHKRTMRERLRAFALRIKEERPNDGDGAAVVALRSTGAVAVSLAGSAARATDPSYAFGTACSHDAAAHRLRCR